MRRVNGNQDEGRLGLMERVVRAPWSDGCGARAPNTPAAAAAALCYITEWKFNIIIMHCNAICSCALRGGEIRRWDIWTRRRRLSTTAPSVAFVYRLFFFFFAPAVVIIIICTTAGTDACGGGGDLLSVRRP